MFSIKSNNTVDVYKYEGGLTNHPGIIFKFVRTNF